MEKAIFSFIIIPAASALIVPLAAKFKPRLAEIISGLTFMSGLINLIFPFFEFYSNSSDNIPPDCLMLFIAGIIYMAGLSITIYAASELQDSRPGRQYFFSMLLLSVSILCGMAAAENFLTLFLCAEALGLAAAGMLTISRNGTAGVTAASDWLFLFIPPSVLAIAGISLLFLTLGNLSFDSLQQAALSGDPLGPLLFAASLMILSFILKAALFLMPQERSKDFRSDLPVSGHLALQIARFGMLYALLRIVLLLRLGFGNANGMASFLMFLGCLAMIAGAAMSCQVKELKKLACFADFSNAGLFMIVLGISTPLSVTAALFIIASNIFGTMLLLICGGITERKKTRNLSLFRSHGSLLTLAGGFSQAGIPPMAGFWSRLLAMIAIFDAGHAVCGCLTAFAAFMLLVAAIRQRRKLFYESASKKGKENESLPSETEDEIQIDKTKEFLIDPFGGNGEKWLKLVPAWSAAAILLGTGILFPFVYIYLNITSGSLFL